MNLRNFVRCFYAFLVDVDKNPQCKHKTFIEELHFIDGRCARRTKRLDERIMDIALKMSARSAKKVVNSGLTVISDDTILRILKKTESM